MNKNKERLQETQNTNTTPSICKINNILHFILHVMYTHFGARCFKKYPIALRACTLIPSLVDASSL